MNTAALLPQVISARDPFLLADEQNKACTRPCSPPLPLLVFGGAPAALAAAAAAAPHPALTQHGLPPQVEQLVDSPSLYADVSLICGSILVTMSAPMQHPNCSRPCSNTQPNLESQLALTASG